MLNNPAVRRRGIAVAIVVAGALAVGSIAYASIPPPPVHPAHSE